MYIVILWNISNVKQYNTIQITNFHLFVISIQYINADCRFTRQIVFILKKLNDEGLIKLVV